MATYVLVRAVPHSDSVEVIAVGSHDELLPNTREGHDRAWILPLHYRTETRQPGKGDVLGIWQDGATRYACAPKITPTKEPITMGGWYECTDGSVSLFRWAHGHAKRVRTVASWTEVPR